MRNSLTIFLACLAFTLATAGGQAIAGSRQPEPPDSAIEGILRRAQLCFDKRRLTPRQKDRCVVRVIQEARKYYAGLSGDERPATVKWSGPLRFTDEDE